MVVRDEEWLVTKVDPTADGQLLHVNGLSELVRGVGATFFATLDDVEPLNPADSVLVGDTSAGHRRARLWLESMIRKTARPLADTKLSVAREGLADALTYQQTAVQRALAPENLRPRILLAVTTN